MVTGVRLGAVKWLVGAVWLVALSAAPAMAGNEAPVNADKGSRVAIHGYDPVAYFTKGQPVQGSSGIGYDWNDAHWLFSEPAHRDLFAADPDKYAPRFGGYCAMGMTMGVTADIDPQAWVIVDGRLYLNSSLEARDEWSLQPAANIAKGEDNWDALAGSN
jgi:hypothetical protein